MGCGQKAVAEDEDAWDALQNKARINGLQHWSCYSREAALAKTGYNEGYVGELLMKYVYINIRFDAAKLLYQTQMGALSAFKDL